MGTQIAKREQHKLPTLSELYEDKEGIIKQNKLNLILNSEPKKEWIKEHPFVKGLKYLPIERVEYLLTMIFGKWRVEVLDAKIMANSVTVSVRLFVKNPLSNDWDHQDGLGASPIQTEKGTGALDFDKMNKSAIQIGLPAAESYAIKDAAEKFGRIFGKDLNRKDTDAYADRLHASISAIQKVETIKALENAKNETELKTIWVGLTEKERQDPDIAVAKELKKESFPKPAVAHKEEAPKEETPKEEPKAEATPKRVAKKKTA